MGDRRLSGPLDWAMGLVGEVAQAPRTLAMARRLFENTAVLPEQLDRVTGSVDRTTDAVGTAMTELSIAVQDVRDRLEHLDEVISGLRDTITALIGAIPGARRALDRVPPVSRPG
ncbi:MAG: hypothetical protein ACYDA2_01015 [Acidimicrobiales bacterium]